MKIGVAMRRALAGVVLVVLLGGGAAVRAQEDTAARRGWRTFVVQGCHGCHTIGAVGTPIGPDLSRVGRKHSEAWLAHWLADPERARPGAHMPLLELSPEDIALLARFLADLP